MDATTPGNSGETSKDFPKNGTGVPHDPVRECSHKETTSAEPPKASIDEPGGSRLLPSASRSENMCIRHKRMADEGATVRLQQVRTGASSSWGAANAIHARLVAAQHAAIEKSAPFEAAVPVCSGHSLLGTR